MSGKYQLVTLGCKVNQYESQQVREVLHALGLDPTPPGRIADIAIVNTCAVTATAMRKSRQAIRRIARGGRTAVIIIGCGASADAGRLRGLPHVMAVLGHDVNVCAEIRGLVVDLVKTTPTHYANRRQSRLTDSSGQTNTSQTRPDDAGNEVSISPIKAKLREGVSSSAVFRSPDKIVPRAVTDVKPSADLALDQQAGIASQQAGFVSRIESFDGRQRAFLKIQDGCDAFCTYCIIPRLRPTLRSKPISAAVAEVRGLVEAGFKEIILTGIFLGAYGRETALRKRWPSGKSPLADLVRALAGVDGLERLRISSLEPGDVDDALLAVLAEHKNCVPHLHLPLQSGSGRILARMNRQYGANAFAEMIDRVRETLDRPAISTDIIVGFPGETEAEFAETLGMARYAGFSKIHAFPFSPREQTAAFRWTKDFIRPEIARERIARLGDLEQELSLAFRKQFVGEVERVIVEGETGSIESKTGGSEGSAPAQIHHGRSDRHFEIFFESAKAKPGDLIPVRIERATPTRTHGTLLTSTLVRPDLALPVRRNDTVLPTHVPS